MLSRSVQAWCKVCSVYRIYMYVYMLSCITHADYDGSTNIARKSQLFALNVLNFFCLNAGWKTFMEDPVKTL